MDPSKSEAPGAGIPGADNASTATTPTIPPAPDNAVDPLHVIAAALVDIAANLSRMEARDALRFNEECKRGRR